MRGFVVTFFVSRSKPLRKESSCRWFWRRESQLMWHHWLNICFHVFYSVFLKGIFQITFKENRCILSPNIFGKRFMAGKIADENCKTVSPVIRNKAYSNKCWRTFPLCNLKCWYFSNAWRHLTIGRTRKCLRYIFDMRLMCYSRFQPHLPRANELKQEYHSH